MSKIIERCAGIDIGKRFLLCCAFDGSSPRGAQSEHASRGYKWFRLRHNLREWLKEKSCHACCDGEHRVLLDSRFQSFGRPYFRSFWPIPRR